MLCVLPLSFDYGLYQLLMCVRVGATLVLEAGFAFPGRVVAAARGERITGLPGVPTIFQVLLVADGPAPSASSPTCASSPTPAPRCRRRRSRPSRRTFPEARLYSMYGLTECKRVAYLPPDQIDARPTSVGIPIPGTEAWIEDERRQRRSARARSAS